jgi:hypothetical protein
MNLKWLFLGAAVLSSFNAFAAPVDGRHARQQQRIAHGIATGELTAREGARLEAREARVERVIARDRADGPGLTAHERAKIHRIENRASRDIYRQKHDGQMR